MSIGIDGHIHGFANIRGGLFQALSLKPAILMEGVDPPGWIVEYFRRGGGTPMLQNWRAVAGTGITNTLPVFGRCASYFTHRRVEPEFPTDP